MIIIRGVGRYESGEIDRLRPRLEAYIASVRQEDGCIEYDHAVDLSDPGLLHVTGMWRDEDAYEAHLNNMGPLLLTLESAKMRLLDAKSYRAEFYKVPMSE